MKQLLFSIFLLSSTLVFGQNRALHINTYQDGDTSLWCKWRIGICAQIELDSFPNAENNWHFRLWTVNQAIDVWEDLNGETFGKITSWAKEYREFDDEPSNQIFYEYQLLSAKKVKRLITLIDSSQIRAIQDEDPLANWNWGQGVGRMTYVIETSNTGDEFFKTFLTSEHDFSEEAVLFQKLVNGCLEISESKQEWADFTSRVPFTCFKNGETHIICRLTNREIENLQKEKYLPH